MTVPIVIDLTLLGFFKYTNFFMQSMQTALAHFGAHSHWTNLHILLPIGISFYTFHTISYIIDGYRRTIQPTRNFWEFACYVSLFSQLVAGPIVRFRQVESDLDHISEETPSAFMDEGWSFFAIGLMKKVLIADSLAMVIDPALAQWTSLSGTGIWLCMLGYTYQLYFDFSGYSDMAVGLGRLFGLRLPQNFNSPYQADSPGDFWRRWHMSLSTCLRDYLYIPLGGNRGSGWFVARNLFLTMLIGGLWHGANWTFVLWGAYHGILLIAQRFSHGFWNWLPRVFRQVGTFGLVVIGWVMFRAPDVSTIFGWLKTMFGGRSGVWPVGLPVLLPALSIAAVIAHFSPNTFELKHRWSFGSAAAITALFGVCMFVMYGSHQSPFLYFQF